MTSKRDAFCAIMFLLFGVERIWHPVQFENAKSLFFLNPYLKVLSPVLLLALAASFAYHAWRGRGTKPDGQ